MDTSYPDENARLKALVASFSALREKMAEVLGERHDPALPQPLRQSSSRKPLPASLPRETRTLPPAETACPACGGELTVLGCNVSEQLELIGSAFKVIETRRPKLTCCSCVHIAQVPMPSKPIERSYADPGLLARIVTAKFAEHSPHYRQSEIYRRQGFDLSRATLGRWSGAASELLEPLYDLLHRYVLMPGKVHTNDIPVQEPGSGKMRTALRDDRNADSLLPPALWFAYSPDRKGVIYNSTFPGTAVSCRRMRTAATTRRPKTAASRKRPAWPMPAEKSTTFTPARRPASPLKRIGKLYAIETDIRDSLAEERLVVRNERTIPLIQSM